MQTEANTVPDSIWIDPDDSSFWNDTSDVKGLVEYRRVDPPAPTDERDKALARRLIEQSVTRETHPAPDWYKLTEGITAALAAVRAEERKATLRHAIEVADELEHD